MSEKLSFRDIKLDGGWLMIRPVREDMGKAMAVVRKHKDKLYRRRSTRDTYLMWVETSGLFLSWKRKSKIGLQTGAEVTSEEW